MWTAVTLLICAFHPRFHGHELQHECHEQIFGFLLWRLKRLLHFQLLSHFVGDMCSYSAACTRHYRELPVFPLHCQALLGVAWVPLFFSSLFITHSTPFGTSNPCIRFQVVCKDPQPHCNLGHQNFAHGCHTLQPEANLLDDASTLEI